MEIIKFNAQKRTTGKGESFKLRSNKKIPAVIYGPKVENKSVFLEELFVTKFGVKKFESRIFQIDSEDTSINSLKVIFKDVQRHPVSRKPTHVDLYALDMTARIKLNVKVELSGIPIGVKEGGILTQTIREVEIECSPENIPEKFIIDVTGINLNESCHVSDIVFPENVKSLTSEKITIATVAATRETAKAEAEEDPAAAAAVAAPEEAKKK